jgi:opacity protein-like surface antigen
MEKTALLLAAVMVLAVAPLAQAETYVGLYGGYALVQDSDFEVNGQTLTEDAEFDSGALVGGKIGYWMKTLPWVAAEVNIWNNWTSLPTGKSGGDYDLDLLNFSGSLLLQYLVNPLRLYAGGGVVGCWADLSVHTMGEDSLNVGAMAQAGAEWEIVPHWGVFAEYRYVYLPLEFDAGGSEMEFDADSNQFLGGVNFRF